MWYNRSVCYNEVGESKKSEGNVGPVYITEKEATAMGPDIAWR